jgi:hypothetical protein
MNWKKFWIVIGVLAVLLFISLCCVLTGVGACFFGNNYVLTSPFVESAKVPEVVVSPPQVAPATIVEGGVIQNDLAAPVLHHSDSHAPEEGYGSFDIGVKSDQIGIAFGWHLRWPKAELDAGGEGCDLVILTPGWYENFQVLDGRYEVYDIPSNDYDGWVEVLGQQRADEQSANYSCPTKTFEDLPQWESSIPSPP